MPRIIKQFTVYLLALLLSLPVSVFSQTLSYMPAVGQLLTVSGVKYDLPYLMGMRFKSDDPFEFTFILNKGSLEAKKDTLFPEIEKINKYFLAALAIPAKDLWVNLSPYEKGRITTQALGATDLGKDMLGEDYVLKQLAASLTHPDLESGKAYWHNSANSNNSTNSLTKIWIVPGVIKIMESSDRAVITEATLKVETREDNKALRAIIPVIEKEVNTSERFAHLRQIYRAVIMASWFKSKLKDTALSSKYFDQSKIKGADTSDPGIKEKIYDEYVKAFSQGVYKAIKTENSFNRTVKKSYFCGGASWSSVPGMVKAGITRVSNGAVDAAVLDDSGFDVDLTFGLTPLESARRVRDAELARISDADIAHIVRELTAVLIRNGKISRTPKQRDILQIKELARRTLRAQRQAGAGVVGDIDTEGIDPVIASAASPIMAMGGMSGIGVASLTAPSGSDEVPPELFDDNRAEIGYYAGFFKDIPVEKKLLESTVNIGNVGEFINRFNTFLDRYPEMILNKDGLEVLRKYCLDITKDNMPMRRIAAAVINRAQARSRVPDEMVSVVVAGWQAMRKGYKDYRDEAGYYGKEVLEQYLASVGLGDNGIDPSGLVLIEKALREPGNYDGRLALMALTANRTGIGISSLEPHFIQLVRAWAGLTGIWGRGNGRSKIRFSEQMQRAETITGRSLSNVEKFGILLGHNIGKGDIGMPDDMNGGKWNKGSYPLDDIRNKIRAVHAFGDFSAKQRHWLMHGKDGLAPVMGDEKGEVGGVDFANAGKSGISARDGGLSFSDKKTLDGLSSQDISGAYLIIRSIKL